MERWRWVSRVWGNVGVCPASGVDSSSTGACIKLRVLRSLSNLADGWPTEPSRQSGRRVWPGSLGSALEPQAKVSRLLPGAPWPGLGARGFRCTAAGGDALLLGSSRRFSTTQLQVGLTPFRLLPAGACTSVSLQADTGASIQSSGLQLAPPPPSPSLLVSAGKGDVWPGLPCCPDPQAGAESLSRSSPLHTWNSSACLPDRAVSEAARLGLAAVGPRRLTPSHQGGVDFPETAGGGGGGITTSAPQAANPCLSTICSPTLRLESLRTRCTFDLTTAGSVAELCPKPLMWLSLVVTPGLLFHVQIFTFFCLSF